MIRKILALLAVTLVLTSCEDTEDNSPALQGEIDQVFFKAIDARAVKNEDGSYLVQGVTQDETLTLRVRRASAGDYNLGPGSPNYATFENSVGNTYTTQVDGGDGVVTINRWDTSSQDISGTFRFNAVLPGIDTLNIQKGFFFKASYGPGAGVEENDPTTNAGTFVANIDGVRFNPFTISAVNSGNSIVVLGSSTSKSITLSVPSDILAGNYELPMLGFSALYRDDAITEAATTGSITIFEHNVEERRLKATFVFNTTSKEISLGQFNIMY